MKKKEKYKTFGTLAVIVSLVAISLTYAGFTQQLTINGTANVKSSSWNVHFANLVQNTTGTTVVNTPAQIKSDTTQIGDYSVTLNSPGDSLTYTFDVVNSGSYNAQLTGLVIGTPSCKVMVTEETNTNTANVCSNLSYELFDVSTGNKITSADNGTLSANGGTRRLRLVLTFKSTTNTTLLPEADIEITGLSVTLTYTQNGNYVSP